MIAQVCDVNKGLLSVSRVIHNGSRVVFDSDGSYIEDKTNGEVINLVERNGMFMMKLWAKKDFKGRAGTSAELKKARKTTP